MCKVTVTTNDLFVWYTCEDCNVVLQNPIPPYPVEWLDQHAPQPRAEPDPLGMDIDEPWTEAP